WLLEGLAVSITGSPRATSWTKQRAIASGVAAALQRGGVSEVTKWLGGAQTSNDESRQYALSGLVLDYLRFGTLPPREQRLFALMGELDRGTPPERAIPSAYGAPMSYLDADLVRWVGTLGAPAQTGSEGLLHFK